MVNATTTHNAVLEQYIDVAMRLISRDYNHKQWNYSSLFEKHISPQKNYAVGFKTQRFDRFVAAASFTVHKNLQSFLDKYENVTNTLACIVRAFIDIPAIQVMATAVALIGHHLILPYLNLTHFDAVNYENLIPAAKQLDVDLEEANPDDILDLSKPAFKFVDDNRFKERNWPNEIIESLRSSVAEYHEEFSKLVMLMVADIKEGWRYQRGRSLDLVLRQINMMVY